ncbi:MAG: pyridoxamine 5'-phosphate oxidase [Labilibaculum sp.]|nr:pyridoxamine 5'-phosphate oxidase [Labilibaculum sp.]MBI9058879.1 pyridoxamine 5'-phosphate oxidase [Labilibaculum sp.]
MKKEIRDIRHEYGEAGLKRSDISKDPFIQFKNWFENAVALKLPDANAMTLATVSAEGKPSARILLLKDFNEKGFCFFTNYKSRKGSDIEANPNGAMVFFWPELERQIRIEGKIEKLEPELSDEYFFERPLGSRMAASVSPQSDEIDNREVLNKMITAFQSENDENFPRPNFWGGYRLIPELFEFWQGRKNRLNDRFEYNLEKKDWNLRRLAP